MRAQPGGDVKNKRANRRGAQRRTGEGFPDQACRRQPWLGYFSLMQIQLSFFPHNTRAKCLDCSLWDDGLLSLREKRPRCVTFRSGAIFHVTLLFGRMRSLNHSQTRTPRRQRSDPSRIASHSRLLGTYRPPRPPVRRAQRRARPSPRRLSRSRAIL